MKKFHSLALAKSYANRCIKPMMVVFGCDGLCWVVNIKDGEKLIKQGYEVAK